MIKIAEVSYCGRGVDSGLSAGVLTGGTKKLRYVFWRTRVRGSSSFHNCAVASVAGAVGLPALERWVLVSCISLLSNNHSGNLMSHGQLSDESSPVKLDKRFSVCARIIPIDAKRTSAGAQRRPKTSCVGCATANGLP